MTVALALTIVYNENFSVVRIIDILDLFIFKHIIISYYLNISYIYNMGSKYLIYLGLIYISNVINNQINEKILDINENYVMPLAQIWPLKFHQYISIKSTRIFTKQVDFFYLTQRYLNITVVLMRKLVSLTLILSVTMMNDIRAKLYFCFPLWGIARFPFE